MSFNRWGDRFVCHNSDHLQAIVFEERYLARNPYQSVASARRSIAADGPQATVYRISPVEGWRIARTKLRVAGAMCCCWLCMPRLVVLCFRPREVSCWQSATPRPD